jgi:DNA-binding response OmpR family regulator
MAFEAPDISVSGTRPRKCLTGVTIILVEDSRTASEALRLMAVASGARLRRADTLEAARRHLRIYRPNAVIVDIGLPDGDGLALIREISGQVKPCPGIIATSGGDVREWEDAARFAGAGTVLPKPVSGVAFFQDAVLAVLPDAAERREGLVFDKGERSQVSKEAVAGDLDHGRGLLIRALSAADMGEIAYCGQFFESVAEVTGDDELRHAALRLRRGNSAAAMLALLNQRLGTERSVGRMA